MSTEITTWAELDAIRNTLDGDYILMNNLGPGDTGYDTYASSSADAGAGFVPIGHYDADWTGHPFTGTFDGNNYIIDGLYINRDQVDGIGFCAGLFGFVEGGTVENLGVTNVDITNIHTDWGASGGIIAYIVSSDTLLYNCYATGSITAGPWEIGGLVGYNLFGTVSNSYSTVTVNGDRVAGGLIGYHDRGVVENSYATGTVTRISGSTYTDFGGFVGTNDRGKIINSYSTGSVYYEGATHPTDKGFVGLVYTGGAYEMTGNFWDTDTSGQTDTAGNAIGKTTAEMYDIATFTTAPVDWDMEEIYLRNSRRPDYIWNILNGKTYPLLSWEQLRTTKWSLV